MEGDEQTRREAEIRAQYEQKLQEAWARHEAAQVLLEKISAQHDQDYSRQVAEKEQLAQQLKDCQADNDRLKAEVIHKQKEIGKFELKAGRYQNENDQLQLNLNKVQANAAENRARLEQVNQQLKNKQSEIDKLNEELQSAVAARQQDNYNEQETCMMKSDNENGMATVPQGLDLLHGKSVAQGDSEPRPSDKGQLAASRMHEHAQLVDGKQSEIDKLKNEIDDKQKRIDELIDEVKNLTLSSNVKELELRTPRSHTSRCTNYMRDCEYSFIGFAVLKR